jgi:hypothetical protein
MVNHLSYMNSATVLLANYRFFLRNFSIYSGPSLYKFHIFIYVQLLLTCFLVLAITSELVFMYSSFHI